MRGSGGRPGLREMGRGGLNLGRGVNRGLKTSGNRPVPLVIGCGGGGWLAGWRRVRRLWWREWKRDAGEVVYGWISKVERKVNGVCVIDDVDGIDEIEIKESGLKKWKRLEREREDAGHQCSVM